jgi:hypothetical protein
VDVKQILDTGKALPAPWTLNDIILLEQVPNMTINQLNVNFNGFDKVQLETFVDNSLNNLVAGTLLVMNIPFSAEAFFSEIVRNLSFVKFCTFTIAQRLFQQHHMRFFLKLEIDAEVIDIETGEITVSKFKFPQSSTWSIRLQSSLNSLDKALDELITSITNRPLGNTKRRLHKFLLLTLKVANRQFGGCKNYKNIDFKNKRCVVHPDGNDNLCFWQKGLKTSLVFLEVLEALTGTMLQWVDVVEQFHLTRNNFLLFFQILKTKQSFQEVFR